MPKILFKLHGIGNGLRNKGIPALLFGKLPLTVSNEAVQPISGVTDLTFTTSGNLTATGALVGSTDLTFTTSGALTGDGALSGATSLTFSPSATLTGSGALIGSTSLTFDPTGTLTGAAAGAISGATSLTFTTSGTLTATGALSGATALTFAPSGTLTASGALAGSTDLTFTPSATITGEGALSGTTGVTFTTSGNLTTDASTAFAQGGDHIRKRRKRKLQTYIPVTIRDVIAEEQERADALPEPPQPSRKRQRKLARQIVIAAGKPELLPVLTRFKPQAIEIGSAVMDAAHTQQADAEADYQAIMALIAEIERLKAIEDEEDEDDLEYMLMAA